MLPGWLWAHISKLDRSGTEVTPAQVAGHSLGATLILPIGAGPFREEAPLVETTPPVHLRVRGKINQTTEKLAHRAALNAAHLLGLALGRVLRDLRRLKDPLAEALARTKEAELTAKLAFDIVDLLSARLDKIPDRHRPYYTPSQRFRILEMKSLLGWNTDLTAKDVPRLPKTPSRIGSGAPTPQPEPWVPR